jgi:cytochrome P450
MTTPVRSTANAAPVADRVTLADLHDDPFPVYRRMREQSPVHWVPAVNRYLVTGYAACHTIDNDQDTFSADKNGSLMKRAVEHFMLCRDDPRHLDELPNTARPPDAVGAGATLIWDSCPLYAAENLRRNF